VGGAKATGPTEKSGVGGSCLLSIEGEGGVFEKKIRPRYYVAEVSTTGEGRNGKRGTSPGFKSVPKR